MIDIYVKVEPTAYDTNYDAFYHKVEGSEKWDDILSIIRCELDSHYANNNLSLEGIKFEITISEDLPHDVEVRGE